MSDTETTEAAGSVLTQEPAEGAQAWFTTFEEALASGDVTRVVSLFGDECYWRDLTALTWNLHTAEGREQISDLLGSVGQQAWPRKLVVTSESEADGVVILFGFVVYEEQTGILAHRLAHPNEESMRARRSGF